MPCNRAVTITKAAVPAEHLARLLTPEVVTQLGTLLLQQEGMELKPGSWNVWNGNDPNLTQSPRGVSNFFDVLQNANSVSRRNELQPMQGAVTFRVGGDYGFDLVVKPGGEVYMSTTTYLQDKYAKEMADKLVALMSQAATQLFASQIQATLVDALGVPVNAEQVEVTTAEGQVQRASLLTINL